MLLSPTEQNVRSLVDAQLKNLGWHLDHNELCNVFQEQPRTPEERKKLLGKRPDYVLYQKDTGERSSPIAVIETKKPGVNLDDALRQADWYAKQLGAPMVFATDGIYYRTFHLKKQKPLYLNGEEVDELMRELQAIRFVEENEVNTISKTVIDSRRELIRIFEESNNILRDEGLRAGIERFGEFANILFLKLISEIEDLKDEENGGRQDGLDRYLRWSQWRNKEGDELLSFVNDVVLRHIGERYNDRSIFTPLTIRHPEILKRIINNLDPLNLINIDSDIKGDSFEYFLKQSTATKNDLGEYFTPRHIVKMMVKLANPQIGEKVYDPFCGTGGTLIESFKHISTNMARTDDNWKRLREQTLYGNEITSTARITKMNMILVGDGHSGIIQQNSLKHPAHNEYDVVITNMPYSQRTEYGSFYEVPTTNGDSICVQHCIEAVNKARDNGRMALVVPEGFLFRKDLQKTREYLLDRCVVKSVISLPQGVFLPYTGVKTDILYCTDVKQNVRQDKVWYFNVRNDGYSLDNHRRKLKGENDLQKFLEYRNLDVQETSDVLGVGFSQVSIEDIKKNDYVLSGSRYAAIGQAGETVWPLVDLSSVATITPGVTYSRADESESETSIRILRANNVDQDTHMLSFEKVRFLKEDFNVTDEKRLRANDVLVCMSSGSKTHLGKAAFITDLDSSYYAGGFMAIVRPTVGRVLPSYLRYIFSTKQYHDHVLSITNGSNINNLRAKDLGKFQFPLPPMEIQQQIADELNSYQTMVDSARQVVANYKPRVDIDSTWKLMALDEVCSKSSASVDPTQLRGVINYIGLENIESGTGKLVGNIEDVYENIRSTKTVFAEGDVLIGKLRPNLNKVLYANFDGVCSTDIYVLRADQDVMDAKFLANILRTESVNRQILLGVSGAQLPRVAWTHMASVKIPVPSLREQRDIVSKLEAEQVLINSSHQIVSTFEDRIQRKLKTIWSE